MSDSLDQLLSDLSKEFTEITDREALRAAVHSAMGIYLKMTTERQWRSGLADTLDELPAAIRKLIELLEQPTNVMRLHQALAGLPADQRCCAPDCIADLRMQLETLQRLATEAHQDRSPKRGPVPEQDVRATVRVLYDYWTKTLGQSWTHQNWAEDKGRFKPITPGERFVWKVLFYIAPNRVGELSTIAREF